MVNKKYLLLFSLFCFNLIGFYSSEYIKDFSTIITINKDRTIDIREDITVISQGIKIKRGIFREFPTQYKDQWGNNFNVKFKIKEVLLDGQKVPYKIENALNGKIIYIGDKNIYLRPGQYTYTIIYQTDKQLGFYKDHDELYWNVTGNGWRFPIANVSAKVILPDDIPTNSINLEAYTGYQGSKDRDYEAHVVGKELVFKTTRLLLPSQGLTIVVSWPKGYIAEPTFLEKIIDFLKDNFHILFLLLGLILLLSYYIYVKMKSTIKPGTIIPLFYPPDDISASTIRYIYKMGYDSKTFASQIVQMAVSGLLKINYKSSGFFPFSSSNYSLEKVEENIELKEKEDKIIYENLFPSESDIKLDVTKQNPKLIAANENLENYLKNNFEYKHFDYHTDYIVWGVIISIFFCSIPFIFLSSARFTVISALLIFLYALINIIFISKLKNYTSDGRQIVDQIEGFKMFLQTTESTRLEKIGTPPTKTPELYEKYLPYAIALDCEKQWSKQFAPIFDNLNKQGKAYQPHWISGYNTTGFNPILFSSNFSNSFASSISSATTTISSSSYAPGTSSGTGGRGSSGGGGGGGGGGGW